MPQVRPPHRGRRRLWKARWNPPCATASAPRRRTGVQRSRLSTVVTAASSQGEGGRAAAARERLRPPGRGRRATCRPRPGRPRWSGRRASEQASAGLARSTPVEPTHRRGRRSPRARAGRGTMAACTIRCRTSSSTSDMLLRRRGERMTGPARPSSPSSRRLGGHLGAEEVVARVAAVDAGVHRASVYRTLDALCDLGVVQHVHIGHGATAYHLVQSGDVHVHAQCGSCGALVDLPRTCWRPRDGGCGRRPGSSSTPPTSRSAGPARPASRSTSRTA